MNFQEWWNDLSTREQQYLGRENAFFVWEECRKHIWEECRKHTQPAPKIQVSGWTLSEGPSPGKVWISDAGGEGGTFEAYELAQAIGAFYKEKF